MLLTKRQVKTVRLVAWKVEEAREGIEEKSPKWRRRKKSGLGEKKPGELRFRLWYHDLIGQITDC